MIKLKQWKTYLESSYYSHNTQINYYSIVKVYSKNHTIISKNNIILYKEQLFHKYKPATINLKIRALNEYNKVINHSDEVVSGVRCTKKTYIDNVISNRNYNKLLNYLYLIDLPLYYLIKLLSKTGMRISEALSVEAEDLIKGYFDVVGKGSKLRRIYVPKSLQKEILSWKSTGLLWNYTSNQVRYRLTKISKELNMKNLHPHTFRHYYAIKFIEKCPDISLLADLMGHSNIETTRIYLRKTSEQQMKLINKIVTW